MPHHLSEIFTSDAYLRSFLSVQIESNQYNRTYSIYTQNCLHFHSHYTFTLQLCCLEAHPQLLDHCPSFAIYCSIIHYLIFFMALTTFILVIAAIFLHVNTTQMYLALPFTYSETTTRTEHIITVEINRYSYSIDITLDNHPTFFLNLAQLSAMKEMVNRVDYRKHKDNIFGILQFTGVQQVDPNTNFKSRLSHNIYSYFRNILPRLAWINLQTVEQVPVKERHSSLSEGTFNFGPSSRDSPILKDLEKYCDYMQDSVISFQMQQSQGRLFLGAYPIAELANPLNYSTVKLENYQNQHWRILTQSVLLRQKNNRKNEEFYLVKEMVKFKLTVSSKNVVLPKKCAPAFEKIIPGCRFVVEQLSGQRLLTCSGLSLNKVSNMELEFTVTGVTTPLVLKLEHLVKYSDSEQIVFYISWGEQQILQIGETLLRQYLLGINYQQGLLHYGKNKDVNELNLYFIFKWLVIGNLLLFIFSLLAVAVDEQLRREVIEAVKKQVEYYQPREGYHVTDVSEQAIS